MPYYRYGNPRCPFYYTAGDHPQTELLRAYYRNPERREFEPIGWYCDHCHRAWIDGEKELEEAQEYHGTPLSVRQARGMGPEKDPAASK